MIALIKRIRKKVRPIYRASKVRRRNIWAHVLRVSKFSKYFAGKMGANKLVAEIGGLLHDIGAAKYGKKNHHIDGAKEALEILLVCGCPVSLIGPVVNTIYSHRGRHRFEFQTVEAKCVAAGDALDHFRNMNVSRAEVHRVVSQKLMRNWAKVDEKIRPFFDSGYGGVKKELLDIVSRSPDPRENGKSRWQL